jgi:integrase
MKAFKVHRNGEVYFRVDLPRRLFSDGRRRSAMGKTRSEALDRAEELVRQRKKGLRTEEARASLAQFLVRFLDYYKTEGGVTLRTWQDYRYHIDANIIPVIGAVALSDLRPLDVDLWLKSLRDRGLGDRTVEYAQAVLRRALQFAVEWEILDRNPAAARFRAAKRRRTAKPCGARVRFLDPEQARRFLDIARGDRHEALYALAIMTGLRPEELYGLRWSDVDLDTKRLTVNQVLSKTRRRKGEDVPRFVFGPPKTDKSRRTLDFPGFVLDLLTEEKRRVLENHALAGADWQDHDLVFPSEVGTPLEERNVLRRFQAICGDHGLSRLRLYDLRHTHASLLIHEGVHPKRISERMGHSSIKLTMDTYGHLFEGSDRDSADKMERLFNGQPKQGRVVEMRASKRLADKTADKNLRVKAVSAAK